MTADAHADVLRRAAKALRNPHLCNPDPAVATGLAVEAEACQATHRALRGGWWLCTRDAGHTPPHRTDDGAEVRARWRDNPTTEPDRT